MPTSLPRMPLCIPTPSISPFRLTLAPSLGTISTSKSHPIGYSNRKGVGFGWRNREKKVFVGINGVNSCSGASENGSVKKRYLERFTCLTGSWSSLTSSSFLGSNFNKANSTYTHAAVIRFPSYAWEIFRGSSEYKEMWGHKFQPITKKALVIYFSVDPVGTQLM